MPGVDLRIGVTYSPKELALDLADDADADSLKGAIEAALGDEGGVLWLTDRRGRTVGVPADKVAYVEIGPDEAHRIGFGA